MSEHQPISSETIFDDKERRLGMRLLMSAMVLVGVGQSLLFTILPPIARDFELTEYHVTMIFSATAFFWTISSPFWGRLSDSLGRKPVMLLGVMGFAISTGGVGLVLYLDEMSLLPAFLMYPLLLLTRGFFGLLCPGTFTSAIGYIADRTGRDSRSAGLAQVMAAFMLGTVIGPGFASVMLLVDLYLPFVLCFILSIFILIAIYIYLPENRSPDIFEQTEKRARLKIKDWRIRDFLFISSLGGLLQAVVLQLTGFYLLDVMHLDTMQTTKFLSVGMMSMAAANIFAQSYVVPRYPMSTDRQIQIGAVSMMVGFFLFLFEINLIILTLAMMFIGYGLGLTRTGSASGASLNVTPFEQGAIAGLLSSTATIGIIFTPIIIVPLYRFYDRGPYVLCILLLVMLLFSNKRAKIVSAQLEKDRKTAVE